MAEPVCDETQAAHWCARSPRMAGRVAHLERAREVAEAALDATPAAGLLLLRVAALCGLGLRRRCTAATDRQLTLLLLCLHLSTCTTVVIS